MVMEALPSTMMVRHSANPLTLTSALVKALGKSSPFASVLANGLGKARVHREVSLPSAVVKTLGKRSCLPTVTFIKGSHFSLFLLFGHIYHIPHKKITGITITITCSSYSHRQSITSAQMQIKFSIVHPQPQVVYKCKYKQTHTKASPYKYCTTTKQVHKYSLTWPRR